MPSHAVEPGTRLVDRYRLEEYLGEAEAVGYWRAHDELLDRAVWVCLLRGGSDRSDRVLEAARRAAALTDGRFLRVLDANEVDGSLYVVTEWVNATDLVELLADGPLPPADARDLVIEVAEALGNAHRAGLAHLCLRPEHILRTAHGEVRIAGLGVDAAALGLVAPDVATAATTDTRGAAAVLYAALTGRWPGAEETALPAAPRDGQALWSPRQVRAGVPDELDEVVCRAFDLSARHGGPALSTPGELAAALSAAHVTSRIPVVRGDAPPERLGVAPLAFDEYEDPGPVRRPVAATFAWTVAVLALVVGFALAGSQLLSSQRDEPARAESTDPGTSPSAEPTDVAATSAALEVAAIAGFDPQGDGEENPERAPLATDDDLGTVWSTKTYYQPFGPAGLKEGVGLLVDLGSRKRIDEVRVVVAGGPTDLEIRTSDRYGDRLSTFELLGRDTNVDGPFRLHPAAPVRARYVLVWLTQLPAVEGGYRGEVAKVLLRGG